MPFSSEFLSLLMHPSRKTPLKFIAEKNSLVDEQSNDAFIIKDGVPILLEIDINIQNTPEVNPFNYREHYQNDAQVYDYTSHSGNPVEQEETRRLHQTILKEIPNNEGWVLDVGCGGAWLAKALVGSSRKVISMDISDINPIKAVKNIPNENHYGLVADVFALPFSSNSVDTIVASEIIEHVTDPAEFINALFDVLKPGGKLIITTLYYELIRTSQCIHCNHETPHNAHLHSFTDSSIKKSVPANAKRITTKIFNNKLLVKTRLQNLLSFLPLSIYDPIDQLGNVVTGNKAFRLMMVVEK